MQTQFGMGIKVLSAQEAQQADLGPLQQLLGTWVGQPGMGWNVIAVPGPKNTQGFTLEVIPYQETLSFMPVVAAGNRGAFVNGEQQTQNIIGLLYEQKIVSACDTAFCAQRGFASGTEIHAETGLFLNLSNDNDNFNIARLSTIPHGNSVLALGQSSDALPANNDFFGKAPTAPTNINGGPVGILGYSEVQYFDQQFPNFDQTDPNTFLQKTLGSSTVKALTTLNLSTKNPSGGILNIPFITKNVDTISMQSTFWIEQLLNPKGGADILQLQYSQTINIVFPPTGIPIPIIWPHVTVNTLQKVS